MAQQLDTVMVKQWVQEQSPEVDLSQKEHLFVIDGLLVDEASVASALSSLSIFDPSISLYHIDSDTAETTWMRPDMIIVLITKAKKSKSSINKKAVSQMKLVYTADMPKAEQPLVAFNGQLLPYKEGIERLNSTKPGRVTGISFLDKPPVFLLGEQAKNGLLRIKTK